MSVSRHIIPVCRNTVFFVLHVCDVNISVQLKQLDCWELDIFFFFFFLVGGSLGGLN